MHLIVSSLAALLITLGGFSTLSGLPVATSGAPAFAAAPILA